MRPPAPEATNRSTEHGPLGCAQGAIAQLGERVLCKHEVVGSIPSGSTNGGVCFVRCHKSFAVSRERGWRSLKSYRGNISGRGLERGGGDGFAAVRRVYSASIMVFLIRICRACSP